jgi:hypothetical protein
MLLEELMVAGYMAFGVWSEFASCLGWAKSKKLMSSGLVTKSTSSQLFRARARLEACGALLSTKLKMDSLPALEVLAQLLASCGSVIGKFRAETFQNFLGA